MRFVLGIHGRFKSGKDTVADYLISHHGWTGKYSFAKNLKEMCKIIFNLTDFQVSSQEGKKQKFSVPIIFTQSHLNAILIWMCRTHGDKVRFSSRAQKNKVNTQLKSLLGKKLIDSRQILQLVGTDVCRTICPDYHLDIVFDALPTEGNLIITDVRFPNEASAVLERVSGRVLKIDRPNLDVNYNAYQHESEIALRDWDNFFAIISNNEEGVESLYTKIDHFLEEKDLWRNAIIQ